MSSFEAGLRAARRRQHFLYIILAAALAAAVMAVATFVLYSRGTAVKVQPNEVSETALITVKDGWAVSFHGSVYSMSERPTIYITAQGFRPALRMLEPETRGRSIIVKLLPLPGVLRATTVPSHESTRWRIAGELVATTEALEYELEAGEYKVVVDNPYFEVESIYAKISRGETTPVDVALTAVQGTVVIETQPPGAKLFLNEEGIGTTPVDYPVLGAAYRIRVELDDFNPVEEEFKITNSANKVQRNYKLQPVSAFLSTAVSPIGGNLLLNGMKIMPVDRLAVSANERYSLTYRLEGYFPFSGSFTLNAGEARSLNIELRPEIGTVDISSSPPAKVVIDSKVVGETPLTLELLARKTNIELRRAGYLSVLKTVKPTSLRTISVEETLVSEQAAKLANSPKAYTNSVGMELVLIKPGEFVMGAPRHEKGQRGNEFLRKVRLVKPFYVAKHETTNAMFRKFINNHGKAGDPKHPVTSVNWVDAAMFCNWLSETEGLVPFYRFSGKTYQGTSGRSDGYRLLTEAEWEWVARKAGKRRQSVFPWGDATKIPKGAGNIADESARGVARFFVPNYLDSYAEIAPVGSFPAEPSGLHDLAGNVSEWVHDYYSLVPPDLNATEVDPVGARYGDVHVVKGSSWRSGTRTTLRAAYREGLNGSRNDVGFRVGRYLYGGD